ncbi:MAG TPA: hypothetical protein VHQ21_06820 [Rhodanobacteraceae bacterium]|nr:hypothetical protein [Rhodanobacteraceae bacterium]
MTATKLSCLVSALLATTSSALAAPYTFSTGTPNNQLAAASRPVLREAADDFVLPLQTTLTSATFTGLLPSGGSGSSISEVAVEIYRVFPLDSTDPPPPGSPTRTNSPSDVAYEARDTTTDSLSVSFTLLNPSFTALNSVLNGIHPAPNNLTLGEGPVSGAEGLVTATFIPAITLPAGHYFFVAQMALFSGEFYWLSGSRPIVSPGTPFASDQQAWIRNANLAPNWLRIGTDIIGSSSSFNLAFTLSGQDDRIFTDSFGP